MDYQSVVNELLNMIPHEEYNRIMAQENCELDNTFMGFVDIYKCLSEIIPKDKLVIDFGCYLAAQSYFFSEHVKYIGVDICELERFQTDNSIHYVMSIQDFFCRVFPNLKQSYGDKIFGICSYVPDRQAKDMVRQNCQNVFCYYPS